MRLVDYLPEHYKNSPEVIEAQYAFQAWAEKLVGDREALLAQLDVATATWGLRAWEAALGIETDITKSFAFRRTRIEGKLRGLGTTTKTMIKNVAESFSNGEVEIIEHNPESWFEVKFVSNLGIPPNMNDLTASIEEIKPAHLAYMYVYMYRLYGELSGYTHSQLTAYTHEQLRSGGID